MSRRSPTHVVPLLAVLLLSTAPIRSQALTQITAWGTVIETSNETYELVGDLHDNGVDPWAITIAPGVHDVVVNGNGYALIGDGLSGSFEGGIQLDAASERVGDVRIERMRLLDLDAGVVAEGSVCHLTIRGCEMAGFTDGRAVSVRTLDADDVVRWVVVRDNRIRDGLCLGVVFENGGNLAGAGAEMSSCSVLSNTISNLSAPVASPEPLRGSVLVVGGGDRIRIRDNVILGGTDLSGVLVSSRDEAGEAFERVSITGNLLGDRSGEDGTASAVAGIKCDRIRTTSAFLWNLQGNYLFFNEGFGIENLSGTVGYTLDARRCWWGDDAGPSGTWGDGASSGLSIDPVLDLPSGLLFVPNLRLTGCVGYQSLVGLYNQDQAEPGLRGFDVDLSIVSAEADVIDYEKGGYFDQTGLASQYYLTGTGDERTVTGTILGGGAPLAVGNGDLFRLLFSGVVENAPTGYDSEYVSLLLRDPDNAVIPVLGLQDARMTVDCTPPDVMISGSDDCGIPEVTIVAFDRDLDEVFLRIAPDCWRLLAQDECEAAFQTTLRLIEFADLPDGTYDIQVCATDDAGNETLETWSFTKDTTPPPPVAGLTVTAGHNALTLDWTPSTYGVEIVRKGWAYPEYDDEIPSPGFPADPADGVQVMSLPPGSGSYVDLLADSTRNAYFYTLFHRDACERASDPDPGAQGVALSYWLGDFTAGGGFGPPYDGYVSAFDLALISGGYGTGPGDPGYDGQLDIGPTDTGYVDGIPLTDDRIDFDDIMIFSIQYGSVGPAVPDAPLPIPAGTSGSPRLSLEIAPGTAPDLIELTVRLDGNRQEVKGVRALIGLEPEELRFVSAELIEELKGLPDPVFLGVVAEDPTRVEIAATPVGRGRVFAGSGPFARITLRRMGRFAGGAASLLEGELRDAENRGIDFNLPSGELSPPAEVTSNAPSLLDAVPNPVRGSTRIRFLLDRPGRCEVAIYDAGGRLVRRLLTGNCASGLQGIDWDGRLENGRLAASGIYHCVLKTGTAVQARRIVVMR